MKCQRGRGYTDSEHNAGDSLQNITKDTARVTEVWIDSRYRESEKFVERDYELALTLANVTQGAARSTFLKVTQKELSHQFAAWHCWADMH